MSDVSTVDPALLRRVLALTPVGRRELQDPKSGLSLPQRWLLGRLDGEMTLADLARLPGSPPAQRLPRDGARLVARGLAQDVGDPGPSALAAGPNTQFGEPTGALALDGVVHSGPPVEESGLPLEGSKQPRASPALARKALPVAWLAGGGLVLLAMGAGVALFRTGGADQAPVVAAASGVEPQAASPLAASAAVPAAGLRASPEGAQAPAPPSDVGVADATEPAPVRAASPDTLSARSEIAAPAPPPVQPAVQASQRAPAVAPPAVDLASARRGNLESVAVAAAPAAAPAVAPAVAEAPVPTATSAPAPTPATAPTVATTTAPTPAPAATPAPTSEPAPTPAPAQAGPAPAGTGTTLAPQAAVVPATPSAPALPTRAAPATPSADSAPAVAAAATPVAPAPSPVAAAAAPAAAPAPLRPLSMVEPSYPADGIGTRSVTLQARMVVAANGSVTQVSFLQPVPGTRSFERAARSALLQWRFPAGAGDRVVLQTVRFVEE